MIKIEWFQNLKNKLFRKERNHSNAQVNHYELPDTAEKPDKHLDIGETVRVVITENGAYYSNLHSTRDIPLGTRGVVSQIRGEKIFVRINQRDYIFRNDELAYEGNIRNGDSNGNNQLADLLSVEEPSSESKNSKQRVFEPKFNVREEFALWVRQEFPKLEKYARKTKVYSALIDRKEEVMKGVRLAYNHAADTAGGSCVYYVIESLMTDTALSGKTNFARTLNNFVSFIEKASANLSSSENRHYGTQLARRREAK